MTDDLAAAMHALGRALQGHFDRMEIILSAATERMVQSTTDPPNGGAEPTAALITSKEAALYLGCEYTTMEVWRARRRGPPYVKVGRLVRYRRQDLDRWLKERVQNGDRS